MTGPPGKRRGPPGGGRPSSESVAADQSDNSDSTLLISRAQLCPRPIGPGELAALRAMWWRQAGTGHHLPAELDIILIPGGAA